MGRPMHPDDVKAADWDFLLSDRFPTVPPVECTDDWPPARDDGWLARELGSFTRNSVLAARARLVNYWPEDGQSIEAMIERFERSFDMNTPAASNPPRGESANGLRGALERQKPRRKCAVCVSNWSRQDSDLCTPCEREVGAVSGDPSGSWQIARLKKRLRQVCKRMGALDIQATPMERGGSVGVKLTTYSVRWDIRANTVMTLTEAELWLDHWEKICHAEQRAADIRQVRRALY